MSNPSKCPVCNCKPSVDRVGPDLYDWFVCCDGASCWPETHKIEVFGRTKAKAIARWEKLAGKKAKQAGKG